MNEPASPASLEHLLARIQAALESTTARFDFDAKAFAGRMQNLQSQAANIGHAGWTLPMWATPAEVTDILTSSSEGGLDGIFLEYYLANGREHYKSLKRSLLSSTHLRPWRPLIAECLKAYDLGLYLIVVPSMITVVEGAVAAAGGPSAWNQKDPKQTAVRLRAHKPQGAMSRVMWISVEAFLKDLFQHSSFNASRPDRINRAWILHGRDATAWTEADCLRLLQAADTIGS